MTSIDFLRRALADEIATALAHSHGLQVRPFAATEKYENYSRISTPSGVNCRCRASSPAGTSSRAIGCT